MKKNVGLLIPSINEGGAERVVSRLSHILSEKYNIFVIVFEDTYMKYDLKGTLLNLGVKAEPGINVKKATLPFRRAYKLKKIKREFKLDVVISFMDSPNLVNVFSDIKDCKTIISIRNYDYNTTSKIMRKMMKSVYSKADYIIPVSKVIEKDLIENYEITSKKIKTIYNPYNILEIEKLKVEEIKEEYSSFFEDGFFYVSVGRNMYQKGYWHLIKSFKVVQEKIPEAKLVIVGRDEMDGKAAKLVKELDIEKNVLFTGSQENPFSFINKSDVYVLSSLFEGFPNGMAEAMVCGCPIIAVDCNSGPREILNTNIDFSTKSSLTELTDYGVLVPPFDMKENWDSEVLEESEVNLAKAMILLKENKDLREYYKEKSLERAKDFDYETCKNKFSEVIEQN